MGNRINLNDLKQYIVDKGFIIEKYCYKCKKVSYRNETDAKVIASEMYKQGKGHTYAYACTKGNGWHLTSKKPRSAICPKQRKQAKSNRNSPDRFRL